jgi:hypothetical protein
MKVTIKIGTKPVYAPTPEMVAKWKAKQSQIDAIQRRAMQSAWKVMAPVIERSLKQMEGQLG